MIRRAFPMLAALIAGSVAISSLSPAPRVSASGIIAGRVRKTFQPVDGKIFVAVIGNDARAGNPDRSRADALHIVGFNTKTMKGGILNFPRDSYVSIPGSGQGRINEALFRGGPALQVRTLESITGIKIDYWVMTGFQGFRKIMRDVGRVRIRIPYNISDSGSGLQIRKGTHNLPPETSLAFVRTRKSIRGGDIARTTHQGYFLLALLRKLQRDLARNPATLLTWTATTRKNTRLDLGAAELFELAVLASQVRPKKIRSVTVPVSLGSVGAASVVFIQPGARAIYKRFKKKASL